MSHEHIPITKFFLGVNKQSLFQSYGRNPMTNVAAPGHVYEWRNLIWYTVADSLMKSTYKCEWNEEERYGHNFITFSPNRAWNTQQKAQNSGWMDIKYHWKPRVIMMPNLSTLMAPDVVVMATSAAISVTTKLASWRFSAWNGEQKVLNSVWLYSITENRELSLC